MISLILILVLSTGDLIDISGQSSSSNETVVTPYRNQYLEWISYNVDYPTNWTSYIPVDTPGYGQPMIGFKAPVIKERLPAYFEMASQYFVRNGTTLETYVAESIQNLREKFQDLTLLSSDTSSELAGNPAYTLRYAYTENETGEVRLESQVGTIIEDDPYHAYYAIYSAAVPDYSEYQWLIDGLVLPSLEIHINRNNSLAATENLESPIPAEQELWLNSGEL
ncbi:MAG TPA: hypothetical protein VE130_15650 [Nitrososphaeraceae archaeon]|nr:hypothetical protein [Nitrososphaeraceae archaeon]